MISLDIYDDKPIEMKRYMKYNGWHFTKKAYEFAVSLMRKRGNDGKKARLEPMKKDDLDSLLQRYNITIENKGNYDYLYVAMMCKADYYGTAIEDEKHMAMFVRDTCDDVDAEDGTIMRRWYATMVGVGVSIPWEEFNE